MYFSLLLTFLLILGVTIFALQNSVLLDFTFLSWRFQTSLVAIIFASCLAGILIGVVLTVPGLIKRHFRARRLEKMLRDLQKKSQQLEQRSGELERSAAVSGRDGYDALGNDNWLK